ncbi:MAG: hypothetical protein R3Y11_07995 [Pseudomonadota bacterium]
MAGALAHELGFDEKVISEMVLVGLLHEVGALRSGPTPKLQSSSNKYFIAWQARVAKNGAAILTRAGIFSDAIIRGVESQFEKNYGGGTPLGLSGKHIPKESRVLHIARMYCQYLGSGRQRLCPHDALSLMFFDFRDFYDDDYLMCFLRLLGVYPVGTYIEISNSKLGIVAQYAENFKDISVLIMEKGILDTTSMPILLSDIYGKITKNIPPYMISKTIQK